MSQPNAPHAKKQHGSGPTLTALIVAGVAFAGAIFAITWAVVGRPSPPSPDGLHAANFSTISAILIAVMSLLIVIMIALLGYARWQQRGEHHDALAETRRARDMADADARQVKATLAEAQKFLDDVKHEREAAGAAARESKVERLFTEAVCHRNKDEYDEAVDLYSQAIELKPDFAEAYYKRGLARGKTGDTEGAIADLTEAIRLKPDNASAYRNLAIQYVVSQQFDEVEAVLQRAHQDAPSRRQRNLLAAAYLKAMALILGRKAAQKAVAEVNRMLKAGVRLSGWDFEPMDRFLKGRRGAAATKARALHNKVKAASRKK